MNTGGSDKKWEDQVRPIIFLFTVLFCVVIIVFGNCIFVPQYFFNNKFNEAFLVVYTQVFADVFRMRIGSIYTDVEQVDGHEPPEEANKGTISNLTDHCFKKRFLGNIRMRNPFKMEGIYVIGFLFILTLPFGSKKLPYTPYPPEFPDRQPLFPEPNKH